MCALLLPADHRRRKKLNGKGCATVKDVLLDITKAPLSCFYDPCALICYTCEKSLMNIRKTEQALQRQVAEVLSKVFGSGMSTSITGTKRAQDSRPDLFGISAPSSKQPCIRSRQESGSSGILEQVVHYDVCI